MHPEAQLADWWTDPRLAYGRGLSDGWDLALQEVLDSVFPDDVKEGVRSLIRGMGADQRRRHQIDREHDQQGGDTITHDHPGSWPRNHHSAPGSWPGLDHMTTAQRRAAWAYLINSWETP